jgi:hypothetical protein
VREEGRGRESQTARADRERDTQRTRSCLVAAVCGELSSWPPTPRPNLLSAQAKEQAIASSEQFRAQTKAVLRNASDMQEMMETLTLQKDHAEAQLAATRDERDHLQVEVCKLQRTADKLEAAVCVCVCACVCVRLVCLRVCVGGGVG